MDDIEKVRVAYKNGYIKTNIELTGDGQRKISEILKSEYPNSEFTDAVLFSLIPFISKLVDQPLFELKIEGITSYILNSIEEHMKVALGHNLTDLDKKTLNNFVKRKSEEGWRHKRGTSLN